MFIIGTASWFSVAYEHPHEQPPLPTQDLGTAGYLVQALAHALPVWCLPSVVAIMGAVVSFATGSAFGTMGVMFPLTLPLGI